MNLRSFPTERQLDMMDCGPACLKMIAKHYGKFYSLQYLRDKCGITKEGVSFDDISHAGEAIGLRTLSLKCTLEDLLDRVPLPAIIHWNNSHFVVVYAVKKQSDSKKVVLVSDPAKGHIKYDMAEFASKWIKAGTTKGILMAIEPQAEFYEKNGEEKLSRKKTLENFIGYFRPYKKSFINLFVVMLLVTILQGLLPFISKSVIDVGIQTQDIDFINIVLVANIAIIVSVLLSNMVRDWI
jgi:ATP-binding cassette subfamily B protein